VAGLCDDITSTSWDGGIGYPVVVDSISVAWSAASTTGLSRPIEIRFGRAASGFGSRTVSTPSW